MSEKDLYRQKMQAQLNEWKADLYKLKAKAEGADADTKLKVKKQIDSIEKKIQEGDAKLAELDEASNEAWDSVKDGVESAFSSLKSALIDADSKFQD